MVSWTDQVRSNVVVLGGHYGILVTCFIDSVIAVARARVERCILNHSDCGALLHVAGFNGGGVVQLCKCMFLKCHYFDGEF